MMPRQFEKIDSHKNYDYLSFKPENILDADMSIDRLVTLLSRETTHTARQVEGRLLTLINSMLANWTSEEE